MVVRAGNLVSRSAAALRGGGLARDGSTPAQLPATLRSLLNSIALMASTASTLVLGFISWLLAARLFTADQVGLASGAVSAMMLCVQIALLGTGMAIVVLLPQHRADGGRVLNSAVQLAGGAAVVAAVVFLVVASDLFTELRVVSATSTYIALFIVMSIAGTLGLLFDQASIALHRSDQVLVRGVSSGVVRLALIAVLPFVVPSSSSELIFVAWVIGSLVAIVLALLHLRRSRLQYRYKPEIEVGMAQRLLRVGLPNHALTLADRAPGLIMPILATEIMSPASGAYWYTLWMMAWVVFVIPQSVGITLFAEAADRPEHLARGVRHGLRTAFALGALAAVFLGVFAHLVLRVLGPGYAAHGATPLRALVLSVFPLTIIQLYFAVSRTLGRLREAVLTGTLAGVTVIGLAVVAGQHAGLTGMAVAWLGTQLVAATWAGLRLRRLVQRHSAALNAAAALA